MALGQALPHASGVGGQGGGHLSSTHAVMEQMKNGGISFMLTTSGLAHPQGSLSNVLPLVRGSLPSPSQQHAP